MEYANESNVRVRNICKCCNPLVPKTGSLKFRRADELDNHYPGTLSPAEYYWCENCKRAFMSPEQCDKDLTREQARRGQLVFVLAPLQIPTIKVEIVDWLKE
jgi:hypothetical protein